MYRLKIVELSHAIKMITVEIMPKYWGKQIFAHGRFPEVGEKQKTEEKKERKRERKRSESW